MLKDIHRNTYVYLKSQHDVLYNFGTKFALLVKYKVNINLYLAIQPKSVCTVRKDYWLKLTMKTFLWLR